MKEKKERSLIQWIVQWAGQRKGYYILSMVLALINVLFRIVPYFLIGNIVTHILDGEREMRFYIMQAVLIAVSFLLAELLHSISTACSHKATFAVLASIRRQCLDKLARVPLGYVKDTSSGSFKNIIVERVDSMETTLAHIVPEFTSNLAAPLVVIIYLFITDWRIALLSMIPIVLGLAATCGMFIGYEENFRRTVRCTHELNAAAVEYINGIEVIKAFGKVDGSYEKFTKAAAASADSFISWMRQNNIFQSLTFILTPYTLLTVLPFGSLFVRNGSLSVPELVMCIILSLGIVGPLLNVMSYTDDLGTVGTVMGEITGILTLPELDRPEVSEAKSADFSVELENVKFSYHDIEVLHSIDMKMASGSVNAIVGPSGSGKSTVAKLIASLWDVDSGSIKIGGTDIKHIALPEYNRMIAYVSQDNYLFNESVRENIRQGRMDATDEEVEEAARKSGCYDFIMQLENGFDTVVGGSGGHLSGGERQRISIARAMLKDAPVVILDEATAYTDPENEAVIQSSVARLVAGKTLIVIAHRLSTITDADRIFVIKDGSVAEEGTHAQLLQKNGIYKEMWEAHISARDAKEEV